MPIIRTEQNPISGQEYLDAGSTRELVGQLKGYAEGYNEGYEAGVAAGGGGGNVSSVTFYAWAASGSDPWFTLSETPEVGDHVYVSTDSGIATVALGSSYTVSAVGEGTISIVDDEENYTSDVPRKSSWDRTITK